jgi:hypothetical protein
MAAVTRRARGAQNVVVSRFTCASCARTIPKCVLVFLPRRALTQIRPMRRAVTRSVVRRARGVLSFDVEIDEWMRDDVDVADIYSWVRRKQARSRGRRPTVRG